MSGDAIGPGDWVESIVTHSEQGDTITTGCLYQVRSVRQTDEEPCGRCGCTGEGLILSSDLLPTGWCLGFFRPIYRPTHRFTVEEFSADKVFA